MYVYRQSRGHLKGCLHECKAACNYLQGLLNPRQIWARNYSPHVDFIDFSMAALLQTSSARKLRNCVIMLQRNVLVDASPLGFHIIIDPQNWRDFSQLLPMQTLTRLDIIYNPRCSFFCHTFTSICSLVAFRTYGAVGRSFFVTNSTPVSKKLQSYCTLQS